MSEAETAGEAIPPTAQNIRAVAHMALIDALPEYVGFSDRLRVSDAVVAAVDPMVRASERERIRHLAGRFKTPVTYPNGYPVEAVPWAAFLDLMAARNLEGK